MNNQVANTFQAKSIVTVTSLEPKPLISLPDTALSQTSSLLPTLDIDLPYYSTHIGTKTFVDDNILPPGLILVDNTLPP